MSPLEFLPIFGNFKGKRVLLVGGTDKAARKLELLLSAGALVDVICDENECAYEPLLAHERVSHLGVSYTGQVSREYLLVVASCRPDVDRQVAEHAREKNILVNVVNSASLSTFIFPSVVNRSPVIAAVSSGGQLPVFTRLLRNRLETMIPSGYGRLVRVASRLRGQVNEKLTELNARRQFWEHHLEGRFAELVFSGQEQEAEAWLKKQLAESENNPVGEVYLVGAGPGDPDLLTLRALRLIRQADIVLYDRLVSPPILDKVRQDAEKIHVGKARSHHSVPQESINEMLVRFARQGKRVLRLKGGDPFIFGRGGEEMEELVEAGVPFQVVPGITAASGCACYAGIPLTHRDYAQSVRFITGHLKNNTCDLPWQEYIAEGQTLVFYMGLIGLPTIASKLIAYGKKPETPVALVSRGTTPEQRVVTSTLLEICQVLDELERSGDPIKAPTLIIVGDVVQLRNKLRWFD